MNSFGNVWKSQWSGVRESGPAAGIRQESIWHRARVPHPLIPSTSLVWGELGLITAVIMTFHFLLADFTFANHLIIQVPGIESNSAFTPFVAEAWFNSEWKVCDWLRFDTSLFWQRSSDFWSPPKEGPAHVTILSTPQRNNFVRSLVALY